MSFDEGDRVLLHDEHSEYDGQEGTVTQVMKTMFGDETYTVGFDEGQESGIPADQLELVEADAEDEADADAEDEADAEHEADEE